jgi:predicted RNA-binding Zn-ribbon protein involved in translation (DUF1610 family)
MADASESKRCTACNGWGTKTDDGYSAYACPVCGGTGTVAISAPRPSNGDDE